MKQDDQDSIPAPRAASGRHAAGEDPAKRQQILNGAMQEFLEKGFDAASMNEICRAAGVSKGTIYVYFSDKVDLFEALIAEERERMFLGLEAILQAEMPLREKLIAFGERLVETLCSDRVIRTQRIICGIVDRMPEMGARFFEAGPLRMHDALDALFKREQTAGRVAMPDSSLASNQFVALVTAGLWRARLFGHMPEPPTADQASRSVKAAVDIFLAGYGSGCSRATNDA